MHIPFHNSHLRDDPERSTREADFLRRLEESHRDLYAYVLSLVANRTDADDVMQDVCAELWEKFDEFDPSRNFRKWASAFAFNIAKSFIRSKRRQSGIGLSDDCLAKIAFMQSVGTELFELRRELLSKCLSKLPLQDQRFLMGYFVGRTNVVRYAETLHIPAPTAYSKLRRLREVLVRCVNQSLGRSNEGS